MALTHYIGGKLVGLTADFPPSLNYPNLTTFINSETFIEYILVSGVWEQVGAPIIDVGGWKEIIRVTGDGSSATLDSGIFATKRYLQVLCYTDPSVNSTGQWRFNSNAGNVYAERLSTNGSADGTNINQTQMNINDTSAVPSFSNSYFANLPTSNKLGTSHWMGQNTLGAANAPIRRESAQKQADSTNPISSIQNILTGGVHNSLSQMVVLEWDPLDSHTDGFWQELATDTLTVAGDNLNTGTIPAKKYLWFQFFVNVETTSINPRITFNGDDTGGNQNYAQRYNNNGGTDIFNTINRDDLFPEPSGLNEPSFTNVFIINNATTEKLLISHTANVGVVGAGNVPTRTEMVGKWVNTVDLITSINIFNANPGTFGVGSTLKVWGHD